MKPKSRNTDFLYLIIQAILFSTIMILLSLLLEKGQLGLDEVINVAISIFGATGRFGNLQQFILTVALTKMSFRIILTYVSRKSLSTAAEMSSKGFPIPRIIPSLMKNHNKL